MKRNKNSFLKIIVIDLFEIECFFLKKIHLLEKGHFDLLSTMGA